MKKKLIIILCSIIGLNLFLGAFITSLTNAGGGGNVFYTIADSRKYGAFLAEYEPVPKTIEWGTNVVEIGEVWLEQKTELVYTLILVPFKVWFPMYKQIPESVG